MSRSFTQDCPEPLLPFPTLDDPDFDEKTRIASIVYDVQCGRDPFDPAHGIDRDAFRRQQRAISLRLSRTFGYPDEVEVGGDEVVPDYPRSPLITEGMSTLDRISISLPEPLFPHARPHDEDFLATAHLTAIAYRIQTGIDPFDPQHDADMEAFCQELREIREEDRRQHRRRMGLPEECIDDYGDIPAAYSPEPASSTPVSQTDHAERHAHA